MSKQVFINGYRLDYSESKDSPIFINRQFINLEKINTWFTDYSNTIKIDLTHRNLKILNYPNKLSSNTISRFYDVKVIEGAVLYFEGKAKFENPNNLILYSTNYEIFKKFSETNLRDLDYSNEVGIDETYKLTPTQAFNRTASYVICQLTDDNEFTNLNNLLPTMSVEFIMAAIENYFDITFENSNARDGLGDLILTDNNYADAELKISTETTLSYSRIVGDIPNTIPVDNDGINTIIFNPVTDTFSRLNNDTEITTFDFENTLCTFEVYFKLRLRHEYDLDQFGFRRNGVDYDYGPVTISDNVDGVFIDFTFSFDVENIASVYDLLDVGEFGVFFATATESDILYIDILEFEITWLPNQGRENNRLIDVASTMPDVSVLDFLKNMSFAYQQPIIKFENNTFTFKSITDLIGTESIDISDKILPDTIVVSTIENIGKLTKIVYADESEDILSCESGEPKNVYANFAFKSLKEYSNKITSSSGLVIKQILIDNDSKLISDDKLYIGQQGSGYYLSEDTDFYFDETDTTTFTAGEYINTLGSRRYNPNDFFNILQLNKKLTCKAILTYSDYANLSQFTPIYLSIKNNSGYFYLNKIKNFKENYPTEIELIKLY